MWVTNPYIWKVILTGATTCQSTNKSKWILLWSEKCKMNFWIGKTSQYYVNTKADILCAQTDQGMILLSHRSFTSEAVKIEKN